MPALLKYALMMLDIVSPYSNFEIEISVYLKCFGMTVVMPFLYRRIFLGNRAHIPKMCRRYRLSACINPCWRFHDMLA